MKIRPTLLLMFLFVFLPATLRAQNKKESPECTVATLEGSFGFTFTGTARTPDGPSPRAGISRYTFDGNGSLSGTQTTVADGMTRRRTLVGSYTVDSDCTGRVVITFTDCDPSPCPGVVNLDIVIDDNGDEFRSVVAVDPPDRSTLTVTGVARKQFPARDSGALK